MCQIEIPVLKDLGGAAFYRDDVKAQYQKGSVPGMTIEPEVPAELLTPAPHVSD